MQVADGRVRVGEAHAGRRGAIEVRRLDPRRAVAADVAVAEIVGIHEDDVGKPRGGNGAGVRQQGQRSAKKLTAVHRILSGIVSY